MITIYLLPIYVILYLFIGIKLPMREIYEINFWYACDQPELESTLDSLDVILGKQEVSI